MQKNNKRFTEYQIEQLRNNFSTIARKHDTDSSYVSRIASGDRPTNTEKAKMIFADLEILATAFNSISA